jgi:Immunoglobulin-like domain of bacterial spore germination
MKPHASNGESTEELLRQALADQAAGVQPDPHALQMIRRRTAGSPTTRESLLGRRKEGPTGVRRTPPWLLGVLGAGVATATVITAVVMISGNNPNPRSAPAAGSGHSTTVATVSVEPTSPTTSPSPASIRKHPGVYDPSAPAAQQVTLYYVGRIAGKGDQVPFRLYPEQHTVQQTEGSPALTAVHEFLTSTPLDHDYFTGWPSGVDVSNIATRKGLTTIGLKGTADLSSSGARAAYPGARSAALQALLATAGVQGEAAFTYNGAPVDLEDHQPVVQRQPDEDVRAWVSITSPVEGQTVDNPVTVRGSANVFEANVNWDLRDARGRVVDSGFATAGFMQWKDFSIDLGTLDPGTYTIRAYETSAKTGRPTFIDDKTFTVR